MTPTGFDHLALAPALLEALERLGYRSASPIQAEAIGPQQAGRDVIALARTGSGKTAAFGLPLLDALLRDPRPAAPRECRAVVLAPTRELAHQIAVSLRALSGASGLGVRLVIGGFSRRLQIVELEAGTDIVVATPGRLADLLGAGALSLRGARHLVIDEADHMLDLGFFEPVVAIAAVMPAGRRAALFSATMPPAVERLAARLLSRPLRIDVLARDGDRPDVLEHAEIIRNGDKLARLSQLLAADSARRVIVFCRTRRGADALAAELAKTSVPVGLIHGDRRPKERRAALDRFRRGKAKVLVATDLMARGIDVPGVSHVVNFELPDDAQSYVHRVGRTGRNGAAGRAITFCAPSETRKLRAIERATGRDLLCRTGSAASLG